MTIDFGSFLTDVLSQPSTQDTTLADVSQPLSVRNNNPGNMRPVGAGNGFQKFEDPQAGIDAMHKDLFAKITGKSGVMRSKYGEGYTPTLANLISTWAPPSENDTKSYINAVSKKIGKAPDDVLTPDDIPQLSTAMIAHEGGNKASKYFGKGTEYAQADTGIMNDASPDAALPDLSHLSDEELDALEAKTSTQLPDLSHLSDAELDALESQVSTQGLPGLSGVPNVGMPKMPVDKTPQVPFYGADGRTPIQEQPSPVAGLMLNGTPKADFFDRTAEDWEGRNQQLRDIQAADHSGSGGQSTLDTLYQTGANLGGRGFDLGMNAAGSLGREIGSEDNNLTTILHDIGGGLKDTAAPVMNPGLKDVADYVKSNPRLARNLSATNDYAAILPLAKPAGSLIGAADDAILAGLKKLPEDFMASESSGRVRAPKAPVEAMPSSKQLREAGGDLFKKADKIGGAVPETYTNQFIDKAAEITPRTEEGRTAFNMKSPSSDIINNIQSGLRDKPMTLAGAQELYSTLGKLANGEVDIKGHYTPEGKNLLHIQNALRETIEKVPDQAGFEDLTHGRKLWAASARLNDIERIEERVARMDNPVIARKNAYNKLSLKLKDNSMGFKPNEIALINRAAKTGAATNLLRLMGSRLGPIAAGAAGFAHAGPLGAAMAAGTDYAIAGAARSAADRIHAPRGQAVMEAIANRPEVKAALKSRNKPIVAKSAPVEAPEIPAAPKQITYQPEIVAGAGEGAVARAMTPQEQVAAENARQRQVDLGITPDYAAASRKGAFSNSGSISASLEGKPGNPITSPKETPLAGVQDLDSLSKPTTFSEPPGIVNTAQKSPESYLGPVENRPDINDTPVDTRPIYHKLNDTSSLLDKAKENLEPTLQMLNKATADVSGAKVMGARIKDPKTLEKKIGRKKYQPNQISDYLGSRVQIDDSEGAAKLIDNIGKHTKVLEEDNFMSGAGRPETGYRAIHLQVLGKDGFSHEVQIMPREIMEAYDKGRHYYEKWKDFEGELTPELAAQRLADQAAGKKLFDDAWAKYEKRTNQGEEGAPIQMHVAGKEDVAVTPSGEEIKVRHAIVDADDLIASQHDDMRTNTDYPQALQPRDRSRFSSHQQIANLSKNLNPRLLMDSNLTSNGSPIISKDGIVESGNGRVLGTRKAYNEVPSSTAKYKQALRNAGYDIDKVKKPMLVRIRETPMNMPERVKFTQASNERTTSAMSATEQAKKDATRLNSDILGKFRGGDIKALKNRDFIKSIVKDIIPENEQASFIGKDGSLSQEGERRINNALLTKAYNDEGISRLLTEGTDNELTSLGKALTNAAPAWAKIKELAKSGTIPRNMDVTPAIVDATKLVLKAKQEGNPLSDYFRTEDMWDKIDPRTKAMVKFLYNKELTRLRSADKITKFLTDYARKAEQITPGVNLFGEKPMHPDELLDSAFKEITDDEKTPGA